VAFYLSESFLLVAAAIRANPPITKAPPTKILVKLTPFPSLFGDGLTE